MKSEKEERMHFPKVTSVNYYKTQEERDAEKLEKINEISLSKITNFPNHPFQVKDDDKMFDTVESVKEHGVLVPAIVRPKDNGEYEMISGHRRKRACELAGLDKIPCVIRNLTDDEATIIMVDSNLQRETILPSERAFAYKMKLEAIKRQGQRSDLTSSQLATKFDSATMVGGENGESRDTVYRYIRLTYLIPELLQYVDNNYLKDKEKATIAMAPAVEISYLKQSEQEILLQTIDATMATPSTPQAKILRAESEKGILTEERISEILDEEKPNQKEQVRFKYDKVKDYFPKGYTVEQMQKVIEKLLQRYQSQWQKEDKRYDR